MEIDPQLEPDDRRPEPDAGPLDPDVPEADALEQRQPLLDEDDVAGEPLVIAPDKPEADVLEQAQVVVTGDDDAPVEGVEQP